MKRFLFLIPVLLLTFSATAQTFDEITEEAYEWFEIDSLAKAEYLFREALKLDPANARNALIFSNIGLIQQQTRRYSEAMESFTYALNITPLSTPVLLNRGALSLETGNNNRAYIDYSQVLDIDPNNTEALLMRAYIYITRRDYKSAQIDYTRLLQVEPTNYSGRLGMANLNHLEKKYPQALELINGLLVEYPEDATLYMMRAGIELDMEQSDLALLDIEKAINFDSNSPEAYMIRGDIYLSRNKKALAKQNYEKAISLGIPAAELRDKLMECK